MSSNRKNLSLTKTNDTCRVTSTTEILTFLLASYLQTFKVIVLLKIKYQNKMKTKTPITKSKCHKNARKTRTILLINKQNISNLHRSVSKISRTRRKKLVQINKNLMLFKQIYIQSHLNKIVSFNVIPKRR